VHVVHEDVHGLEQAPVEMRELAELGESIQRVDEGVLRRCEGRAVRAMRQRTTARLASG
jgi:hypothetical protein